MKLDRAHFAVDLDVVQLGLLEAVRTGLFSGKDESKNMYADLYKLNVYGTRPLPVTCATLLSRTPSFQARIHSSRDTKIPLVVQKCSDPSS